MSTYAGKTASWIETTTNRGDAMINEVAVSTLMALMDEADEAIAELLAPAVAVDEAAGDSSAIGKSMAMLTMLLS